MKTKALISFAVTAKLICVFVIAYAKSPFSYDAAHIMSVHFFWHVLCFDCVEMLFEKVSKHLQP